MDGVEHEGIIESSAEVVTHIVFSSLITRWLHRDLAQILTCMVSGSRLDVADVATSGFFISRRRFFSSSFFCLGDIS